MPRPCHPHRIVLLAALTLGCAANPDGARGGGRVALLSPVGESVVGGVLDIVVGVESFGPVERIELTLDDGLLATWDADVVEELHVTVDTAELVDGPHVLHVQGTWLDGGRDEALAAVMVDNGGPSVVVDEPLEDQPVYYEDGPFGLVVAVADASRVRSIRLRVEGQLIAEIEPVVRNRYSVVVDPLDYLPADSTTTRLRLSAQAEDSAGHFTVSERTVDVVSRVQWTFDTLGAIWEAPEALPGGAVATVTSEAVLHVLNADGTERCHVRADGERGTASPTYAPAADAIVWGTTHRLRVTSASTCALLFTHPLGREFVAKPVVTSVGTILATAFDGTLVSFRPDGSEAFSEPLVGHVPGAAVLEVRAGLALGAGDIVYQAVKVGATGGALLAIHPDHTIEAVELTAAVNGEILIVNDAIYFGARDGSLYSYGTDLVRRWVAPLLDGADILVRPAFDGSAIITEDGEGRLHGRNPATGAAMWTYDALLDRSASGVGLVGRAGLVFGPGGDVAFGDALGMVHVLGSGGLVHWRAQVSGGGRGDGIVARPALGDARLFVASESQRITALALH